MNPGQRIVRDLVAERPAFHPGDWGCSPDVLGWLATHVQPGWVTLETGSGHSTAALVALGCRHTAVSPAGSERARIVAWCRDKGIDTTVLTFVEARSQDVLPTMTLPPLDLVLIDGWHAFPVPFLDWYYTARALKVGGVMVIDDTPIRPVRYLVDYLRADPRWRLDERLRRTAIFTKTDDPVVDTGEWHLHPHSRREILGVRGRVAHTLRSTRGRVRAALRGPRT